MLTLKCSSLGSLYCGGWTWCVITASNHGRRGGHTVAALSLLCRLWADESISNRSGIVLASGTLHLITSNRATGHYSEDQMSLKKGNVLFISVVSGAIYIQPITIIMWACCLSEYTVIPWCINYSRRSILHVEQGPDHHCIILHTYWCSNLSKPRIAYCHLQWLGL